MCVVCGVCVVSLDLLTYVFTFIKLFFYPTSFINTPSVYLDILIPKPIYEGSYKKYCGFVCVRSLYVCVVFTLRPYYWCETEKKQKTYMVIEQVKGKRIIRKQIRIWCVREHISTSHTRKLRRKMHLKKTNSKMKHRTNDARRAYGPKRNSKSN